MDLPPPGAPASLPADDGHDAVRVPARMPAFPELMGVMQFRNEMGGALEARGD
jgi:hypothetical protein